MKERADAGVVALFGSENRALVLAVLANASGPLTAYRVARTFGGQKIKVIAELKRLRVAGIVASRATEKGRLGWVLSDPDLRSLLRKRARICFAQDWDSSRPRSGEQVDRLLSEIEASLPSPRRNPEFYRPKGWEPSAAVRATMRETVRPPEKDAILRRYGARTSRHEGLTL